MYISTRYQKLKVPWWVWPTTTLDSGYEARPTAGYLSYTVD